MQKKSSDTINNTPNNTPESTNNVISFPTASSSPTYPVQGQTAQSPVFQNQIAYNSWWQLDQKGNRKFYPPILADYLLQTHELLFYCNSIYIYIDGYYQASGEAKLTAKMTNILDKEFTQARVSEVLFKIKAILKVESKVPDAATTYLNLNNGILDLTTNTLLPHSPQYRSVIRIPHNYDSNANCQAIEKFLHAIVPSDRYDLLLQLLAYCLVPTTKFEKAFLIYGAQGRNGKSKFLNLLEYLLGDDNIANESLQDLCDNRFRGASLVGKLANICADLPNKVVKDTSIFKKLVSGDKVSMERKFETQFQSRTFARLVFSANEIPLSLDSTGGYFRRWVIIPFPNHFPENSSENDPDISSKLCREEEISGLLNILIPVWQQMFPIRGFIVPEHCTKETEKYARDNNPVAQFVYEKCKVGEGLVVGKTELFASCNKWRIENGYAAISQRRLNQELQQLVLKIKEDKNHGSRIWKGISLLKDEKPDMQDEFSD
jgi:putative DNA primase/helicase